MPLMRDITCVTSSSSSRDRQRSTAAAGSSPMLSRTIAARPRGVAGAFSASDVLAVLLGSDILLRPLSDDFRDALGLLRGEHLQVIDHHVHGGTWWRQIVVFEKRADRYALRRLSKWRSGACCASFQRWSGRLDHLRFDGLRCGRRQSEPLLRELQKRPQNEEEYEQSTENVGQPGARVDDVAALFPPRLRRQWRRKRERRNDERVAARLIDAEPAAQHALDIGQLRLRPGGCTTRRGSCVQNDGDVKFAQAMAATLNLSDRAVVCILPRRGIALRATRQVFSGVLCRCCRDGHGTIAERARHAERERIAILLLA